MGLPQEVSHDEATSGDEATGLRKKTVLSTRDLNLYYGTQQALFEINLEIQQHQVTAFIGPSGCGKSSLLRCFNRMNDTIAGCSVEGVLLFHDQNIYSDDFDVVRHRARIGMVFQKPTPFPRSIFDNVAYGPRIQDIASKHDKLMEIVEESLRFAGLWDEVHNRLDAPATSLSGGQQQRLCIARAIAIAPEVILMDEPCSALDPIASAKIEDLIDRLREQYTVIIVTHSMQQAARVSQKTAFFHLGRMVEFNDTKTIFNNPRDQQTQNYITGRYG